MKTLLRNASTGLYFQGPDLWTSNPAKAHKFLSIDHALNFVRKWRLQNMELAFAFGDFRRVTGVPIEKGELKFSES